MAAAAVQCRPRPRPDAAGEAAKPAARRLRWWIGRKQQGAKVTIVSSPSSLAAAATAA